MLLDPDRERQRRAAAVHAHVASRGDDNDSNDSDGCDDMSEGGDVVSSDDQVVTKKRTRQVTSIEQQGSALLALPAPKVVMPNSAQATNNNRPRIRSQTHGMRGQLLFEDFGRFADSPASSDGLSPSPSPSATPSPSGGKEDDLAMPLSVSRWLSPQLPRSRRRESSNED